MAKRPTDKQYAAVAKRLYQRDGELEFDDAIGTALVSRAPGNPDKGAYVQCWRWIEDSEVHAAIKGRPHARKK
jgi:hypothetical protein